MAIPNASVFDSPTVPRWRRFPNIYGLPTGFLRAQRLCILKEPLLYRKKLGWTKFTKI